MTTSNKVRLLFLGALLIVSNGLFAQTNPYGDDVSVTQTSRTPAAAGVSNPDSVAIGQAWVNVRSGPGTGHSVLKTLARGTSGTVLATENGWSYVRFASGLVGWVRSDLLSSGQVPSPTPLNTDQSYLDKSFKRWEKHLGGSYLNFDKVSSWWKLGRAWKAYQSGDYQKAYELAQADTSDPFKARYLMAKCLFGQGQYADARAMLKTIEKPLEDAAFLQALDKIAQPYIDEPIVFKFGGFDDLPTYRMKKAKDMPLGLESKDYYEKYVDINTWQWRSQSAYKEFQKIGGIDCSGFVQMVLKESYGDAGKTWPISGRTSTSGLWSQKFSKEINPGQRPPPPPDIRPGDMILLDYGHNRYGHSMIYRGKDANGNIHVLQMGDTAEETILSPEKFQYYKGTYRMNGMDEVRQKLTA